VKTIDEPIIIEETFNFSIEAVWKSLTDIELMRQWYFDNIPAFKPEVGFETQFNIKSEQRNFLHKWKVLEVEPLKKIKYSWEFEEYRGKSTTNFELTQDNNLTKLTLSVEVQEDFPESIPEFKRESCIGGWNYFINNRLKEYLKNNWSNK
jgi:uncharacterized protein YndB with AHSA1/START domain